MPLNRSRLAVCKQFVCPFQICDQSDSAPFMEHFGHAVFGGQPELDESSCSYENSIHFQNGKL